MDKIIDGQFLRVDKALSTLITSIATYNPNPQLATNLVVADEELAKGLQELSTHQAKHQRILSLRATSQALDEQIRETLTLLTTIRTELIATPATIFPEDTKPVPYSELLSYARRISKFTKPPTFRETIQEDNTAAGGAAGDSGVPGVKMDVQGDTPRTNGSSTPVVANAVANGLATGVASSNGETGITTPVENNAGLSLALSQFLDPRNDGTAFVPWPTDETIRRGALASIQILVDQGFDPATFDPERSAELELERRRLEEEAEARREVEMEELARRERELLRAREEMARRQSGGAANLAGAAQAEERRPAQFQLLDLDEMDDDDD